MPLYGNDLMDDLESYDAFDAIIATVGSDRNAAQHFIEQLRVNVAVADKKPRVELLEDIEIGDKYDSLYEAMEGATLLFIFVSRRYMKEVGKFDKLIQHVFVDSSLSEKEDCVVPLWVDLKPGDRRPDSFRTFNGYIYSQTAEKKNELLWKKLIKKWNSVSMLNRRKKNIQFHHQKLQDKRELEEGKHNRRMEKQRKANQREKELAEADRQLSARRSGSEDEDAEAAPGHMPRKNGHHACESPSANVNISVNFNIGKEIPQAREEFGRHQPPRPETDDESLTCAAEAISSMISQADSETSPVLSATQNTTATPTTGSATDPSHDGDNDIRRSDGWRPTPRSRKSHPTFEPGRTLRSHDTNESPSNVSVPEIPTPVQDQESNAISGSHHSGRGESMAHKADSHSLSISNPELVHRTPIEDTKPSQFASDMNLPSGAPDTDESFTRGDRSSPQPLTINPREYP